MRICEECQQGEMCILRDEAGNLQIIPRLQAHKEEAIADIDDAIEHLLKMLPRANKKTQDSLIRAIQDLMHINAWLHTVQIRRR